VEGTDMRIDSMDAQFKVVDRVAEIPLPVQGQQKTIPVQRTEDYKPEVISEKVVISAIERANKAMVAANRALEFSIHEKTKEIMVKVVDTETKEVVREIPSEKILDILANILEMAGLLVDERR
jgi:flagellar protein FlaG